MALPAMKVGEMLADVIIEMVHLFYQKATASRFLSGLLRRLAARSNEFE